MTSPKTYIKAASVTQAISCATGHFGNFRYLAGGTDVMVNKFQGNDEASLLIDISEISDLKGIVINDSFVRIGALTSLEELIVHPLVTRYFPVMAEAVKSVASPVIRKTATLGGNLICENRCSFYNQSEWWREAAGRCLKCDGLICLATGGNKNCFSKFVSDTAVALISLNSSIEVSDNEGVVVTPIESIYTGDGINPHQLNKTAIINAILLPLNEDSRSVYKKLRKRETLDFTSLTTAVTIHNDGMIRMVLGGVHAKPVIVDGLVNDDLAELINQAVSKTRIVDNDTYSRAYRKEMVGVFLKRSFKELQLI